MKKIILKNVLSFIILILIILSIIMIFKVNVLPTKYLIIFIGINLVLFILGLLLYNLKNKFLFILGIILYLCIACCDGLLYYYVGKTNKYIDNNFSIDTYKVKTRYYLVTSSQNNVNTVKDISKSDVIKYYKYSRALDLALKKVKKFSTLETDNIYDTLCSLNNGYLLLSSSDYNFVLDASNNLDSNQFKVIYKFDVFEDILINTDVKDIYNIYINGLDYSGNRRDFNMIATVNTKTNKIVLTSIPRDFYIYVPAYDMKDSLTALGTVDPDISKEALEKLFDIKIDYTINLYTNSLVDVVDTIGGVEFCSGGSFVTTHDLNLGSYEDKGEKLYVSKGCKTYNGKEALAIARERLHISNGDRARQDNCRQILINIGKKLASYTTLTNYNDILESFDGLYTTNVNKTVITNLIKSFISNPNYTIIEQSVDGVDGHGIGRLGSSLVWTLEPKMYTVENASNQIKSVINGE